VFKHMYQMCLKFHKCSGIYTLIQRKRREGILTNKQKRKKKMLISKRKKLTNRKENYQLMDDSC